MYMEINKQLNWQANEIASFMGPNYMYLLFTFSVPTTGYEKVDGFPLQILFVLSFLQIEV
jgi:hypothetical protein